MPFSLQLQIRFLRSLCEVTTGAPLPAKAKMSLWISPLEAETSRNFFCRFKKEKHMAGHHYVQSSRRIM